MDPVTVWREANISLAIVAFVWLMIDLRRIRLSLSSRRLYLTLSLASLLLATFMGSIADIRYHNPAGLWTAFATASCVWCIIGLWIGKND